MQCSWESNFPANHPVSANPHPAGVILGTHMATVLLPSDDRPWIANFAHGYSKLGFDVLTGSFNFELEACAPDVIHLNWPEELTGWACPSDREIYDVEERLKRWSKISWIVASVNNLRPHNGNNQGPWRKLYLAVYSKADVIHHFSHLSRDLFCREFPEIVGRKHVVTVGFNYERLLESPAPDRQIMRSRFGFGPDDVVFLNFGALRSWDEVLLLIGGFNHARVAGKKLLVAGRYEPSESWWQRGLRRAVLNKWKRGRNIASVGGFVPEGDVRNLFAAADALVVVRTNGLGSGLPSLGMTLGLPVIAPIVGVIPEYLSQTGNVLYDPSSPKKLGTAIERMARLDRLKVGSQNAQVAAQWGWREIVSTCISALPSERRDLASRSIIMRPLTS